MNKLPYLIFLTTFFVPFFVKAVKILPGSAVLLFELVSGVTFLAALIYGALHKSLCVSPKYIILFVLLCLHFLMGTIANSMDPAAVLAGIRSYLKFMPLFLLPLVYSYSDNEIKGQLKFLTVLGLLQLPLVLIQFFILHWYVDLIAGTLVIGSTMSVFMVSGIAILTAFYFRREISGRSFLILTVLFLIPTTLNESKGTIILLIFGLLIIMLGANLKKSQLVIGASVLAVMVISFTLIYDMYIGSIKEGRSGLMSFFTTDLDKGIINYLYSSDSVEVDPSTVLAPPSSLPGASPAFDPEKYRSRRIDAIILPLRVLSDDPIRLMLGLGIGNASKSVAAQFAGKYSFIAEYDISYAAISLLLWEIGVIGLILYLVFFYFVYKDARFLTQDGGLPGAIALGWVGVTAIIVLTLPYKNIFVYDVLCALFWYFSGYIAAKSYELRRRDSLKLK